MIYLSQILDASVKDSSDGYIGKIKDVLINPMEGQYPPLGFLFLQAPKKEPLYIPYRYVENLGKNGVTLTHIAKNIPSDRVPPAGYIFLKRDVLDQQIVDVEGARVVRVNDIGLGFLEEKMSALGLDISLQGLLRRLGLGGLHGFGLFKINLIDWKKAELVKGALKINTLSKNLTKLHPADLANIIEDLNLKHGSNLVNKLTAEAAAKVIEEVDPEAQKLLVKYLGPDRAAKIIEKMSIDEIVDLMKMLTHREAKGLLSRLQPKKASRVQELISYPNDTAGGLMTTDFIYISPHATVRESVEEIKKRSASFRSLTYIYVIDPEKRLKGTVSLRNLLVASPDQSIKEVMKKPTRRSILHPDQSIHQVIRVMTKYNLYVAAVVNKKEDMIGVVTLDDIMRHLFPYA